MVAIGAIAARFIADFADWISPARVGELAEGGHAISLILAYWVFVLALVVAERRWPAERTAGTLSTGGAVDLIWMLMAPLSFAVVAMYFAVLGWVISSPLSGAHLDLAGLIGAIPAAIAVMLVADFSVWLSHIIRHRVPLFWRFHCVHHSQTQMSVLTGYRRHVIELIVTATIVYLPARLLGMSDEVAGLLALANVFLTGFTHANVRTNLGPLRWILVSPQSHRVHHSSDPRHFGHNFGAALSIWDRLFGLAWPDPHENPSTGIGDPAFPVEEGSPPITAVGFYLRQIAYPFVSLVRARHS